MTLRPSHRLHLRFRREPTLGTSPRADQGAVGLNPTIDIWDALFNPCLLRAAPPPHWQAVQDAAAVAEPPDFIAWGGAGRWHGRTPPAPHAARVVSTSPSSIHSSLAFARGEECSQSKTRRRSFRRRSRTPESESTSRRPPCPGYVACGNRVDGRSRCLGKRAQNCSQMGSYLMYGWIAGTRRTPSVREA